MISRLNCWVLLYLISFSFGVCLGNIKSVTVLSNGSKKIYCYGDFHSMADSTDNSQYNALIEQMNTQLCNGKSIELLAEGIISCDDLNHFIKGKQDLIEFFNGSERLKSVTCNKCRRENFLAKIVKLLGVNFDANFSLFKQNLSKQSNNLEILESMLLAKLNYCDFVPKKILDKHKPSFLSLLRVASIVSNFSPEDLFCYVVIPQSVDSSLLDQDLSLRLGDIKNHFEETLNLAMKLKEKFKENIGINKRLDKIFKAYLWAVKYIDKSVDLYYSKYKNFYKNKIKDDLFNNGLNELLYSVYCSENVSKQNKKSCMICDLFHTCNCDDCVKDLFKIITDLSTFVWTYRIAGCLVDLQALDAISCSKSDKIVLIAGQLHINMIVNDFLGYLGFDVLYSDSCCKLSDGSLKDMDYLINFDIYFNTEIKNDFQLSDASSPGFNNYFKQFEFNLSNFYLIDDSFLANVINNNAGVAA